MSVVYVETRIDHAISARERKRLERQRKVAFTNLPAGVGDLTASLADYTREEKSLAIKTRKVCPYHRGGQSACGVFTVQLTVQTNDFSHVAQGGIGILYKREEVRLGSAEKGVERKSRRRR